MPRLFNTFMTVALLKTASRECYTGYKFACYMSYASRHDISPPTEREREERRRE